MFANPQNNSVGGMSYHANIITLVSYCDFRKKNASCIVSQNRSRQVGWHPTSWMITIGLFSVVDTLVSHALSNHESVSSHDKG